MDASRPWEVLLIGGASGVGKTSVSYRLARHFGVGITEVDDFQVILERMTDPETYPELHLWRRDPQAFLSMHEDEQLAFMIRYGTVMVEALEYVIGNHLEGGPPIVLEGDFLLPEVAVKDAYADQPADGRVRAIVIVEPEEAQIARNYLAREGEDQPGRARLSWRYSEWLREEAGRLGVPAVPARPWGTVFERSLAAIGGPPSTGERDIMSEGNGWEGDETNILRRA
jgi:2-phosphoglycerate kinase